MEMVEKAVEDATMNACQNNITNANFYAGKAELLLSNLVAKALFKEKIVAVLDPPRGGLRKFTLMLYFIFN